MLRNPGPLVAALYDAAKLCTAHVPDTDEHRLALGTWDVVLKTLHEAGVTDIRDLRRKLRVKENVHD